MVIMENLLKFRRQITETDATAGSDLCERLVELLSGITTTTGGGM